MNFTLIIPAFNEEEDISYCIESCLYQSYQNFELIVVNDGSTDNTKLVINSFKKKEPQKIKIINIENSGRCHARNIGIQNSSFDYLVFLNADNILPQNFLSELKKEFENGYDSVSSMNKVRNMDDLFARYIEMENSFKIFSGVYRRRMNKEKGVYWCEGFAVKKSFVLRGSLFPSKFDYKLEAGEDVRFVDELRNLGVKGIIKNDLFVEHIAPSKFSDFLKIRISRGSSTPAIRFYVDNWTIKKISLVAFVKLIKRILIVITIIPLLLISLRNIFFSNKNKFIDFFNFTFCWIIENFLASYGEFRTLFKLKKR
tara:strand:- start:3405 stop:4343 length:939 start_codon:yes stop_codon:yes gene_type:complete